MRAFDTPVNRLWSAAVHQFEIEQNEIGQQGGFEELAGRGEAAGLERRADAALPAGVQQRANESRLRERFPRPIG